MTKVMMNFVRQIKQKLSELNFFELEIIRLKNFDQNKAKLATRIYIIIFSKLLTILIIYLAFQGQNRIVIIQNPSQSDFTTLLKQYPHTLTCPCQQISILYESFLDITLEYHPICSSVFVSDDWINLLFNYNMSYYYPLDFRSSAMGQFQILSSLCSLSKEFLNEKIRDLLSDAFISPIVLSPDLLDGQSQLQSSFIRTSTSNNFLQLLQLIRGTTFANTLQDTMQTSARRSIYVLQAELLFTLMAWNLFSGQNNTICYCGIESTCSSSFSGFFNLSAYEPDYFIGYTSSQSLITKVPGFVVGCYALESLLQSSLECFYDLQCLNLILNFFSHNNTSNITYLNKNKTKYSVDALISTLVDNLFIEEWAINTSFSSYYSICAPVLCTYTFVQYADILYVVTRILGFYGGLVIVLRFCIPRILMKLYKCIRNDTSTDHIHNQTRFIDYLRNLSHSIAGKLKQMNLFKKYDATHNNPYDLQTARIATRIYIILFVLTMCILIIYESVAVRTQTFTISQPSQTTFEKLHIEYSDRVKCPCKQSIISYEHFLFFSPEYHPVCSSSFISFDWLLSLSFLNWQDYYFDIDDFRIVGQVIFKVIATLCSYAEIIIRNSLLNFKHSLYVTEMVLSKGEMIEQIQEIINKFQLDTIANFKQNLNMISLHTMNTVAVAMANADSVSYKSLNTSEPYIDFHYLPMTWNECSCALSDDCIIPVAFYEYPNPPSYYPKNLLFNIPGLFVGCFSVQSVLQSSFECFYNETCLDMIQTMIHSNRSIHTIPLNQSQTRHALNSSIELIFNDLMLEKWGEKIEFDRYYEKCAPISCVFTTTKHSDLVYIITSVIALFGGVSITLKILTSFLVRWVRNRSRPNLHPSNFDEQSRRQHFCQILNKMKRKLKEYNIFESELTWQNEQRRQKEIRTTRIYFLLLLCNVFILLIFTSFSLQTKFITINYPSQSIFDSLRLDSRISPTLECFCQQITISYSSFISIQPHFHQLCSSDFTDPNSNWTSVLYSYGIDDEHTYDDYRLFALPQFRTLSSLCDTVKTIVTNNLIRFSSKTLINKQIQSYEIVQSQTENAILRFRSSICKIFVLTLNFIREVSQGNGILSSIYSNWYFQTLRKEDLAFLWTKPRSYGNNNNCSCATDSTCSSPAKIANSSIPGFRIGCYVIDSLLQSTLECLYDISCINLLKYFYSVQDVIVSPLNTSLSSSNETVQNLVDRLLINEWKFNISYENYYHTCSPHSCRYLIQERSDVLYIIVTIIGFYGGLPVALKIIAPLIMNIGQYFLRRFPNRTVPEHSPSL
ncbi:hypothetical protein I4U23_031405 [Adineta vaga]|nr:hypothetical protein I4U23_031405 [Adineta vaga]